ncbi:MAG: GNAT family N-acetyltransferase [Ruminococcaceae bacterium]|jgi:ribosomal protein S18 acetylase RimI-like enzyme|nr:GNAT family N-acetyltransferase [Oscillospiraceae bacterium]
MGERREPLFDEGRPMDITIRKMESDEEIRGKAFVHWRAWHEAYPGLVSGAYLDKLTLERCEAMARSWPDNILVAKDGERVIGFVGFGDRGGEMPDTGEIFALYVLAEYYGTGVGRRLLEAALAELRGYPQICLWVLKENGRAIRFYRKCGFCPDGAETDSEMIAAAEIRMVLER